MKILHITNDYYYSEIYGNLHKSLSMKDIESRVIVPVSKNSDYFDDEDSVIQLRCFKNIDRLFYLRKQKKIADAIEAEAILFKPDIIHCHFVFASAIICLKLKEMYGIPYVVAVRNTDVNYFFKKMIHLRSIGVDVLKNAEKIIFISEAYKNNVIEKYVPDKLRDNITNKSLVIPNGIDDFWHDNKYYKNITEVSKALSVVTVGTINKNKNQLIVAKVLNKLVKRGMDISYVIVGRVESKRLHDELSKYPFVEFRGFVNKPQLKEIYCNSDIFILLSHNETFGLVYAEALSQGVPVIYSENQGFDNQFVNGEIGYSNMSKSEKELERNIFKIRDNYKEISLKCTELSNVFDWNKISDKYIKVYKSIDNKEQT